MGIKLVRNFEEGQCVAINDELLLQTIDDNREFLGVKGKKYFIFNPTTNQRFEVMPEIAKYNMTDIYYGATKRNYIIFTSAKQINEREIEISYVWYNITEGESKVVYKEIVLAKEIGSDIVLKVFVLNGDYCIFERVIKAEDGNKYELYLKDITNDKGIVIDNSKLVNSGIESVIGLVGNKCCIKLGQDLVGVINVNRFVSDLAINLEDICIDVLDTANEQITIPYVGMIDNYLVYSKVGLDKDTEEIVFYDYLNKIKKVRLNGLEEYLEFKNIHIISGTPYYLYKSDSVDKLVNLDTQKVEYEFDDNVQFKCAFDDLIVITKKSKGLFGKNYIEVYRNTDFDSAVYKIKGIYRDVTRHFDDLLVFWD